MRFTPAIRTAFLPLLALILLEPAFARRIRPAPAQSGLINLPYMTSDSQGSQWTVYQPGNIQMQGNMPVYSQAAQLTINGNQPGMQNNMGRIDEKTGELLLENMTAGSLSVTRRLLFDADENYVRVIDVIHNTQGADQTVNIQLMSNLNFGVQSAVNVPDPKHKDQPIGWVAQLNGAPRAAVELFAGKGSKVVPAITYPPGNNYVQATLNVNVPANQEIAFVHVHGTAAGQDAGVQWINAIKDEKLLADVPKELRRIIVNFKARPTLPGDLEVLRGDVLDAVELRSGDRVNGNLVEPSYKLDTFYGTVDLPADRVVGILNAGQFRPRQLIVLSDGQIFGGHLQKPTIDLQLSSGQKTQIPLTQINRVGYRLRPGESEDSFAEQVLQPPYLLMSSGDRVAVEMPPANIAVVTRYGQLDLSPTSIASIAFTSDDSGVHTITLTDGSHFAGLVTQPEFAMKLATGGNGQPVHFPVSSLARLVVKTRPDDRDDNTSNSPPTLQLKKDDTFVGTLQDELKLDTGFDTITLNAAELRGMIHASPNAPDISVTTWDGTVLSGQLVSPDLLSCHLASGIDVHVPVALVQSYTNTQSQAPTMMLDRIKAIITQLNADDWKQRDSAEKQLLNLGPNAISTIKGLRDKQPPEAQQRIDSVLKQLEKQREQQAKENKPEVAPPISVGIPESQ
jgi:hypothetical protein